MSVDELPSPVPAPVKCDPALSREEREKEALQLAVEWLHIIACDHNFAPNPLTRSGSKTAFDYLSDPEFLEACQDGELDEALAEELLRIWRHGRAGKRALSVFAVGLVKHGRVLPERLRALLDKPAKLKGRGPDSTNLHLRNFAIWGVMAHIVNRWGILPTRNDGSKGKHECAASIVRKALKHLGVSMSEKTVATIYQNVMADIEAYGPF
jgi:hypothetical protein